MATDKRKIRAIDNNTIYDVPAKMMKIAREVRDGKHGPVEDVIVLVRSRNVKTGYHFTTGYHYGTGNGNTAYVMLSKVQHEWMD